MALVDERAAAVVGALRDAGAMDDDLRTTGLNLWFDQSENVRGLLLADGDDAGR